MFSKIFSLKRKRPPLRLLVLIVAATIILITVVIFRDFQTNSEIKMMAIEQFNRQQMILACSTATSIEAYTRELSEALLALARIPSVERMSPECLKCMQHIYWGFPQRTSIRLLDRDGSLRFIYPFDSWREELIGRDYSKETYFQEARIKR
ncbi:hypothetical protein ES703_100502 [subsurface metagenome]